MSQAGHSTAARVAWAFLLGGVALAAADASALAALGFADQEQAEVVVFLPRLLLGLPLMAACCAWLATRARGVAHARFGRRAAFAIDVLCVLPLWACVLELVSGRAIAVSPWRWPLAALAMLAVLLGSIALRALVLRAVSLARRDVRAQLWTKLAAFSCVPASLALASHVTTRFFRGLYPAFHQGLALGTLALCAAAFFTILSLQAHARRFWLGPSLAALATVWLGSDPLTWHAAGGRRVLAETAPFSGAFVPAMFRADATLHGLTTRSDAAVSGSSGRSKPSLSRMRFASGATKRSLLLVTIDALRADVLEPASPYSSATPFLQRLAARAVRFERAYASSNNTNDSLPPLLSGVVNATGLLAAEHFLPAALAQHGYDTLAWVTNNHHRAEDEITHLRAAGYHCRAFSTKYAAASEVIAFARTALDGPEPQLVWIHLSDVHSPYWLPVLPTPKGRSYPNEYAKRLAGVDVLLAPLLEHAHETGVVWALSSDHGEALGEHGTWNHDSTLYDEQLRVPLLVGGQGLAPRRVSEPVSTIDLAATLAKLAGASLPAGTTVLPPWAAGAGRAPVLGYAKKMCALVHGDHKLIADTATQTLALFDLARDPGELHSRLREQPQLARKLLREMRDAGCRQDLGLLEASIGP